MQQQYIVGLDVGTTSVKAVVFTLDGHIVATGRRAYQWDIVRYGAEIDAMVLADAAHAALREAIDATPAGPILAVGIASIGESGVLLDGSNEPLAPVIAWHDKRDGVELSELADDIGIDRFSSVTGLPFRHQWSLTKHRWFVDTHSDVRNIALRLNVAEWIAFSLGAAPATELSLASRTGWFDVVNKTWWSEALAWSRLSEDTLPELVTAGTRLGSVVSGVVSPRLVGAAITTAGQDHQSAAVGLGATMVGAEVDSCGTAEALVRTVDPISSPASILALTQIGVTVGWHAHPGRWCLLAGTEGGLILSRALSALGTIDFAAGGLDDDARKIATPGVRAFVDDAVLLGFAGIGNDTSPAQLWRSAIELVTEQVTALHDSMSDIVGGHRELIVTGGWSASGALLDCKRRRLGEFSRPDIAEAGARGAAIFAGMAAGLWSDPSTHTLTHSAAQSDRPDTPRPIQLSPMDEGTPAWG
jgi:sugar (pentulose or hexulose) kinase